MPKKLPPRDPKTGRFIKAKPTFKSPPKLKGFNIAGRKDKAGTIKQAMGDVRSYMEANGLDTTVHVHRNKDGSIDAEVSVKGKRGVSTTEVYTLLQESLPKSMTGAWFSAGARFDPSKDADYYTRYKGVSQVQTHYQKYTPGKRATNLEGAIQIAKRLESRQRRKIHTAFARVHWNQEGSRPGKPGRPPKKNR